MIARQILKSLCNLLPIPPFPHLQRNSLSHERNKEKPPPFTASSRKANPPHTQHSLPASAAAASSSIRPIRPVPAPAMAVSNNITACLNFLVLLCTIPIAATGIWLASKQGEDCTRLARWPIAILGALLLLVALAGFAGAYWNRKGLLACYLFAMAALITLLLALLVFAFAVAHGSGAYPVLGRAYEDYRLEGYSGWLRGYVTDDPRRWEGIRSCIAASDTCRKLAMDSAFIVPEQFYMSHLSPIQSGCCKPPTVCGYAYVSPTVWTSPANPAADPDCAAWSNDQAQLCYGCASCKAGVLGGLREQWRRANVALLVATVALIFVYVIGCSAFRNAQTEDLFRRYKWGNI